MSNNKNNDKSFGRFIVLEGADGVGKSTQAELLASRLSELGHEVVRTREPGGSEGAELIRDLLVSGEPERWSPMTEMLLFAAARCDHVEKIIKPALQRGAIVICDRYIDSTRLYQSYMRGLQREVIDDLHARSVGLEADLVLILDADVEKERINLTDRYEKFGDKFQKKLREGYVQLANEKDSDRIMINASGTPEQVFARIAKALAKRWPQLTL